MKSQYWYTDQNGRKKNASLSDILNSPLNEGKNRGLEITYDKRTDKFFFCYPVDYNFFPEDDRRQRRKPDESQVRCFSNAQSSRRMIVIDPGVRKFGVGYDPDGKVIYFADRAKDSLLEIMVLQKDEPDPVRRKLYSKKMKDMTDELHWKIIRYIVNHYDDVMIPNFQITGMVKKGQSRISKETKRLLYCFRFYSFMEKLKYKCKAEKKRLYIVEESYTSKTCTNCGTIQDVGGREKYKCKEKECGIEIDRDINGSRNILIKNVRLR